ncbi:hypothetical protein V8C86DRAFT_3023717, partial [Haematococcus lacustris]
MSGGSIAALAASAPAWVLLLNYGGGPKESAAQRLVSQEELQELRQAQQLQVQTLLVGLTCPTPVEPCGTPPGPPSHQFTAVQQALQLPLPSAVFRPLQLLVALQAAGQRYQPLTVAPGRPLRPPLAWCLPQLLFPDQEQEKLGGSCVAAEEVFSKQEAARLVYSWPYLATVLIYSQEGAWRCRNSLTGAVAHGQVSLGRLTELHPVLGLQQQTPPGVWVPTALCLPLGAIVHACACGFKYQPLSLAAINAVNKDCLAVVPPGPPLPMNLPLPSPTAALSPSLPSQPSTALARKPLTSVSAPVFRPAAARKEESSKTGSQAALLAAAPKFLPQQTLSSNGGSQAVMQNTGAAAAISAAVVTEGTKAAPAATIDQGHRTEAATAAAAAAAAAAAVTAAAADS